MSGPCSIKTHEEFKKAENRKLVKEIENYTTDDQSQITMYNVSLLPDFKEPSNLKGVRTYIEITETKNALPINGKDRLQILSMFLGKKWDTLEFLKAFSENGLFNLNDTYLSKYLNPIERDNVFKKENQLKSLYYKIKKHYPLEASPIIAPFTTSDTFLSDEIDNPDIIEDIVKSTYAGIETIDDIIEKKEINGYNNPKAVQDYMKGKGTLGSTPVSDMSIDGHYEYYDNLESKLTYLIDNSTDLSDVQGSFEEFFQFKTEKSANEISDFFNNELGISIDLNTLNGSEEDITDFLEKLYDFTISQDRINKIKPVYFSYLKLAEKEASGYTLKHSLPEIKNAIVINSKSEQLVFDKHHSILAKYPNVYVEINKKTVNWAVAQIFEEEKSFVEDRSVFEGVSNIPYNEDNRSEIEEIIESNILKAAKKYGISEELAANKFLYQMPFEEKIEIYPGTVNLEIFIPTLFKELPSNDKNIFSIRKDGTLYMRGQGEYTRRLLELSLSKNTFENMLEYANISMEPSMAHLRSKKENATRNDYRNFYANNPKALINTNEEIVKKLGNSIIALGAKQDFMKVNGEVYEKVNEKLGIFEKLENFPQNNFNISQPQQSLDDKTVENILENTLDLFNSESIVYKPEKKITENTVKNPILTRGKKTLKEFREDYRKFFDKNVNIGHNGVFSREEKETLTNEIHKLNEEFKKQNNPLHYVIDSGFYHNRNNDTFELLGIRLAKGNIKNISNDMSNKIETIPSQTLKELEQQPFLTLDQIEDAYSAIFDNDVKDWTEEDLNCQ